MSKELLSLAKALSGEKGVDIDVVLHAIEAALESAITSFSNEPINVRVSIDSRTGEYKAYRYWEIVAEEDFVSPDTQMTLEAAQAEPHEPSEASGELSEPSTCIEIGGRIEKLMPPVELGRIEAQAARHVIMQKIREAERHQIAEQFMNKLGQLVYGTVKKVTRDNIIIDLGGKAEAFMPRTEVLPNEMFRVNDRVRAYLYSVTAQARGPQLLVSRTKNEMLIELFRIEVPEIGENVIDIKAAAREPGSRAKIAVKTNDGRIDPIGACVGMRGARVQAVSSELGGERVDIILWDDNPAQLVINAMAPAEITSIVVDEDSHTMDVAVQKEQLSQAIGRNGQNVRLASQLTGWELNVMTVEDFSSKTQAESDKVMSLFIATLGVDEELASLLVTHGFSSLEEIAYVPREELLAIPEFDEEIVEELRNRANDTLLAEALAGGNAEGVAELLAIEGMTDEIAEALIAMNVKTVEELAEQSVDELLEIPGMTREKAGSLIMKAREPWFHE